MIDYTKTRPTASLLQFLLLWTLGLALLISLNSDADGVFAVGGRVAYWLLHIGTGLLLTCFITRQIQNAGLFQRNAGLQWLISGLVGAIAFVPLSVFLEVVLPSAAGPVGHDDVVQDANAMGFTRALMNEFAAIVPTFLTVWVLINLTYTLYARDTRGTNIEELPLPTNELPTVRDGLYALLKPALGTDIVLLRSDLNYLHVHTTKGRTMLLYSLSRATEELEDRGLLVHRSYWVAKDHVIQLRRQNRQYVCEMSDESSVPVSRRRQAMVLATFGSNFTRHSAIQAASDN